MYLSQPIATTLCLTDSKHLITVPLNILEGRFPSKSPLIYKFPSIINPKLKFKKKMDFGPMSRIYFCLGYLQPKT